MEAFSHTWATDISIAGMLRRHWHCCLCSSWASSRSRSLATNAELPSWLRSAPGRAATPLTRVGRFGLLATGAGMLLAGVVILSLGTTEVFVSEDLAFMGVTRENLDAVNPRLVPSSHTTAPDLVAGLPPSAFSC